MKRYNIKKDVRMQKSKVVNGGFVLNNVKCRFILFG